MKNLSKKKSFLISFSVIFAIFFAFSSVFLSFILTPEITDFSKEKCEIEYIILLGGGIKNDGSLPSSVINRCKTTIDFFNLLQNQNENLPKIIITGGTLPFKKYEEASAIKSFLIKNGLPEENLFTERKAQDTIQNFQFSKELICTEFNKTKDEVLNSNILIITNYFHLNRAEFIAKRLGYKNILGLAAKTPVSRIAYCYTREILSYFKLSLRILFTGNPK